MAASDKYSSTMLSILSRYCVYLDIRLIWIVI